MLRIILSLLDVRKYPLGPSHSWHQVNKQQMAMNGLDASDSIAS